MPRKLHIRERLLIGIGLLVLALLVGRAAQVQIVQHERLDERALLQQTDTLSVPALRGSLRDRFGTGLSQSLENESVWADPGQVETPLRLDCELADLGWTQPGAVVDRLSQAENRRFTWLYRGWTSPGIASRLRSTLTGVYTRSEPKRIHVHGSVLGPLLGRVDVDGVGLTGMEKELDSVLQGRNGRELRFVTGGMHRRTSLPPRLLEPPRPGRDVNLTIDLRAQEITVRRLEEGLRKWNARAAFGLVMDPRTGEILAVASIPSSDPKRRRPGDAAQPWRLRPFTDQWEPGSTFKVVTFAAALEDGGLDLDEVYDCEDGQWTSEDWRISDHEPYGLLTARDVLVHSSNVGAAKIALSVGAQRFYAMCRKLGFGLSTGVRYPYEARGSLRKPEDWNRRSLPTMGFGQELSATALQVALLYGAVANGGLLMQPQLVHEVLNAGGGVDERVTPRVMRRALKEETSRALTRLLRDVVVRGTGKEAEIPWFPPAGKTGTAQMADPETGRYSSTDYMASFVGFAPWYEPRYLCIVALDSPQGSIYGGTTAAPIFREILEDLTAARGVLAGAETVLATGDGPDDGRPRPSRRTVPDVRGLSPNEARAVVKAAGFVPVLEGRGMRVREIDPAPGSLAAEGDVVRLLPSGVLSGEMGVMPDLRGWPLRKALVVLSRMGASWAVRGDGWVARQAPAPGTRLSRKTRCSLRATHAASAAWNSWRKDWEGLSDASAWGDADRGS